MKALNTIGAPIMVDPSVVADEHTIFVAGEDDAAKAEVVGVLESMGWARERILDLGGIQSSRSVEMYVPLWLSLYGLQGSPLVSIKVVHGAG